MQFDALSKLMTQQVAVYAFLQRIYEKEVETRLLAELPIKLKPLSTVAETVYNTKSKKAVEGLVKYVESFQSQDLGQLKTTLAADYARLFLSINKVPAHPSESAYREGVMMQHYRDEVLKTYWSFGISTKKEFTEPEDHIATELSFMAYLCSKAGEALNTGDIKKAKTYIQAQKDFLETHLTKWIPKLIQDIYETAQTPFYKGIAALTGEFIDMSLSAADDTLDQLKG